MQKIHTVPAALGSMNSTEALKVGGLLLPLSQLPTSVKLEFLQSEPNLETRVAEFCFTPCA